MHAARSCGNAPSEKLQICSLREATEMRPVRSYRNACSKKLWKCASEKLQTCAQRETAKMHAARSLGNARSEKLQKFLQLEITDTPSARNYINARSIAAATSYGNARSLKLLTCCAARSSRNARSKKQHSKKQLLKCLHQEAAETHAARNYVIGSRAQERPRKGSLRLDGGSAPVTWGYVSQQNPFLQAPTRCSLLCMHVKHRCRQAVWAPTLLLLNGTVPAKWGCVTAAVQMWWHDCFCMSAADSAESVLLSGCSRMMHCMTEHYRSNKLLCLSLLSGQTSLLCFCPHLQTHSAWAAECCQFAMCTTGCACHCTVLTVRDFACTVYTTSRYYCQVVCNHSLNDEH